MIQNIKQLVLLLSALLFMNNSECLDSVNIQVDSHLAAEQKKYQTLEYRKPQAKHDKQSSFNATAPGQLDRTFGTDGKVISTSFNGALNGLIIRPTPSNNYDIVTTGTENGTSLTLVTYSITNGNSIAKENFTATAPTVSNALALDSLNRIVCGGTVGLRFGPNFGDFMARRYINSTTVDASFNAPTGTAIASRANTGFNGQAVAIDNQNRILVAGSDRILSRDRVFSMVRFTQSGQLDSSFGGPNAPYPGYSEGGFPIAAEATINGVAVQNNGGIIVVGDGITTQDGYIGQRRFLVARYTANGVYDTTWPVRSAGFRIVTDFTPLGLFNRNALAYAVALQADGKIVAVGTTATSATGTGQAFVVARYNTDGTLDTTFGNGGLQVAPFAGTISVATALAIDDQGFISVAGYTTPNGVSRECFALAVFNPDGSLNNEFGTNGLVVTPFGNSKAVASSVAIEPINKRIIVGGTITQQTTNHFALACYNGIPKEQVPLPVARFYSDGTLDPKFGR